MKNKIVTKHKVVKPVKPEANIHIMIQSPNELRKQVLALTIETIELIKRVKTFKDERDMKKQVMNKLKSEINHIKTLASELEKNELPLDMKQVDELPFFKKKQAVLEKVEKARTKAERYLEREEAKLEKELAKPPGLPPEMLAFESAMEMPKPVATISEIPEVRSRLHHKPKDPLETDLDDLRNKMAQL